MPEITGQKQELSEEGTKMLPVDIQVRDHKESLGFEGVCTP